MITIGLATGGIKANVTPMCAEQYQNTQPVLRTLKSGEQVVVDPQLTVQRLFMWFYWVVNIGALSPLITVHVEKHHSFWLAYLLPLMYVAATRLAECSSSPLTCRADSSSCLPACFCRAGGITPRCSLWGLPSSMPAARQRLQSGKRALTMLCLPCSSATVVPIDIPSPDKNDIRMHTSAMSSGVSEAAGCVHTEPCQLARCPSAN